MNTGFEKLHRMALPYQVATIGVATVWVIAAWAASVSAGGVEGAPRRESLVGKRYPSERSEYTDGQTSRKVVRLTASDADDVKIYQTHPSWTADGDWIVFHSNRATLSRAGRGRQLFAVRERDGVIVQLTDEPDLNVGQVCLSRKRPELLTVVGSSIVRIDMGGLLEGESPEVVAGRPSPVADLPEDTRLSGTMSLDSTERRVYLGLEYPQRPGTSRWAVAALELETARYSTVAEPGFRVGHVQANPWREGRIQYCHETGGDAPQRMWTVKADGGDHRPLYKETFGEWVTHEVWASPDRALFTVWPEDDSMRRKPHGIASVSLDGDVAFHSRFPCWHVTGTKGCRFAVGDTFDGRIFRVDLRSGEKVLLTAGHRPASGGAHPHPSLHPDGDRVLFNSNARGSADLCLARLHVEGEPPPKIRTRSYRRGSPEEARAWQQGLRRDLLRLLSLDDLAGKNIPLKPEVVRSEKKKSYILQELTISSTPGRRISVIVTIPDGDAKGLPAVVAIHGHGGNRRVVHDESTVYKGFAAALAARGFVTISTDVGQHEVYEKGRTLMGERLWDLMRCVDYLETLPRVDTSRMGCAGLSLGGEMAMWLGALDVRMADVVSSGFLTTMDQMEMNHCMCWKFPGLREIVDYADIYSLIAPRRLQCQNGLREGCTDFWVPLARHAMSEIKDVYEDLGKPENVSLVVHEGGHEVDLPALLRMFEATP